ncbi:Alkaline phosphatase synthesis sensor protein PhoR [Intestinibacter bartlettii]|uniref:histidine kinase n=3 Tax=Bacillota TaxID=1239 RepID=A0A6N2ZCC7_9FIRM
MNTLNQVFLLNNINFIFTTTIMFMIIFIYSLERRSRYISFLIIYSIELILFLSFKQNFFNCYSINIAVIFIVKILWVILNLNSIRANRLKKIELISINILGLLVINESILLAFYINLLVNFSVFYNIVYKMLYKISKNLVYIEGKNNNVKNYINDLNNDIAIELNKEESINKKEQYLYNILDVSFSTMNRPIFLLDGEKIIYTNNKLDTIFCNKNLKLTDLEYFFKSYFFNSNYIIEKIKANNNLLKLNITSFRDNIYELLVVNFKYKHKNRKMFIFNNVTDIHNKKLEIKHNEENYKKLVEALDDGIVIADKNDIYYINKKIKELLNINDKNKDIFKIEDLANYIKSSYKNEFVKNIITAHFNEESKIWVTKTIQNTKLKVIENKLTIDKVKNIKIIMFSDITENQNLLDDIVESEKIYRVLLESLPDGIVIIDKKSNKHIYKNKYIIEVFKKIKTEKFNNMVNDCIESEDFDTVKIINLNEKESASIVVSNIAEQNIYIVIFKMIRENNKANNQRSSLEKIQQNEAFKTQFYKDVVDKIQEPVNEMIRENKFMDSQTNSSRIDSHICLVRQNLYRLKKVLDNINNIMDIENYSYDLDYTVFDLVQLLKQIVNLSKYYIDRKNLSINLEFSDDEILVYLDSVKLQKIILNILSNAIKFSKKNGTIKVSVEKKLDFIVINIKDNGIGIPKDKVDFIFGSFNQIDKSLTRLAEGMGMGLCIAKKLADIQGLYLNVESEENKGSQFKILIKNTKNSFLDVKYKKDIHISKEFVDIQFSDIYLN